jgi:hypothetical protein
VAVGSGKKFGLQAPCPSVDLYETSVTDQIKVQGAMVTELDYGVGNVTAELVAQVRKRSFSPPFTVPLKTEDFTKTGSRQT